MRALLWVSSIVTLLAGPAAADTITSTASANVDGVPTSASDTTSLFNDPISAQVSVPSFATIQAQAAQNITVLGAKGAVAVEGVFAGPNLGLDTLAARNTLISTATTGGTHQFSMFLLGAQLRTIDFAGMSHVDPFAPAVSYAVSVVLNRGGTATTLFESSATLTGGLISQQLVESGEDLGGTFFSLSPFSAGYNFDPLFRTFDLGVLDVGDFVSYDMSVSLVSGRFELGGAAFFGDPNDIDATGSGGLLQLIDSGPGGGTTDPVPEPGTIVLFGLAAGSFCYRRWRRRVPAASA